jgi:hypothetical protein
MKASPLQGMERQAHLNYQNVRNGEVWVVVEEKVDKEPHWV